jgi:dUTP pyrophosphatase
MKFKRIGNHDLPLPQIATDGSAGYDLQLWASDQEPVKVMQGCVSLLCTGFSVEIPRGMVGLLCSRSGLAIKDGVFVLNAPGIIDSDYRGEIRVILASLSPITKIFKHGDRIAQLVIVPCVTTPAIEGELGDTERGSGGRAGVEKPDRQAIEGGGEAADRGVGRGVGEAVAWLSSPYVLRSLRCPVSPRPRRSGFLRGFFVISRNRSRMV